MQILFIILLIIAKCHAKSLANIYQPEQIKLSFATNPFQLIVSWISFESEPFSSVLQWGNAANAAAMTNTRNGNYSSYPSDTCPDSIRSTHVAYLDISPGESLFYRVSSDNMATWSDFIAVTGQSREYPQSFATWGDMGLLDHSCNPCSTNQLAKDAAQNKFQYSIHFGDTAYNMDENCSQIGDDFLNAAMSYSSSLPIIYTNGNHEGGNEKRYKEYVQRLAYSQNDLAESSGSGNNRYFLWRVGPITFFTVDPDAWIYVPVYPLCKFLIELYCYSKSYN